MDSLASKIDENIQSVSVGDTFIDRYVTQKLSSEYSNNFINFNDSYSSKSSKVVKSCWLLEEEASAQVYKIYDELF
jgi:hypothetical protein